MSQPVSPGAWVVDPRTRTIQVYRQGGAIVRYRMADELRDDPALPGFVLPVAQLFSDQ